MTDRHSDGSTTDAVPAPETDFDFLDEALSASDAVAFVHVGDRFDDDVRYLTRFSGPDRDYAFVYTPERAVLCAPSLFEAQARREFDGEVRTGNVGDPAGVRARAVLDDLTDVDETHRVSSANQNGSRSGDVAEQRSVGRGTESRDVADGTSASSRASPDDVDERRSSARRTTSGAVGNELLAVGRAA